MSLKAKVDIVKDAVHFCQNVTALLIYYFSHKSHFNINHNIFTIIIINVCLTWVMVVNKL